MSTRRFETNMYNRFMELMGDKPAEELAPGT